MARFLSEHMLDVLCLQETKCPNDQFPDRRISGVLATKHIALHGQKGYHGVANAFQDPVR